MTSNLLVFVFFALFITFLIESVYYLRKKMNVGPMETESDENNQNIGKIVLAGGLIVIVIFIAVFSFFFLSGKNNPSKLTISNITPTTNPTQIPLSPTPIQVVYNFPTVTGLQPSPTLAIIVTVTPAKILKPKQPTPTIKPSPTALPTTIPTIQVTITAHPSRTPTPTLIPSIILSATPSPTKMLPIGGPVTVTLSINQASPTSALVIVPKMPVSGSIQQTLTIFLLGFISLLAGLIV